MSVMRSLTSIDESEYDRIEGAMSESERGRWFLAEYARRNRTADTDLLLGAISRLENAVTADRPSERDAEQVGRMRGDLLDMAHAIARTKAEIAAISTEDQSRLGIASVALDAIIRSTERATSDILGAAEEIQETAWTLRESGTDTEMCDVLDRRATEIYTACSFQDLTAQRTARIIHTLRYLEERIAAMIAIWGGEIEAIPPAPGATSPNVAQDLDQSDVDRFIDMDSDRTPSTPAMPPLPASESLDDEVLFLDSSEGAGPAQGDDAPITSDAAAAVVPTQDGSEDVAERATDVADDDHSQPADIAEKTEMSKKTDIATAFADIDGLSEEEKLALFS